MADTIASTRSTTSEVERQELSKRRKAFWLYFLRGPVWYGWTRLRLEGFAKRFENIFGLNLLANIADDYKNLIDEYHYCELHRTSTVNRTISDSYSLLQTRAHRALALWCQTFILSILVVYWYQSRSFLQ